jgi:L-ascorbate metabolism protein UlaG (beta-lactamase superfamily)
MAERNYYLRPDVMMEPLINQWSAWPFLIPPATAAMTIAKGNLKVMKSFVMAPQIHKQAVNNPAMRGGPFLDVPPEDVGLVKQLVEKTQTRQAQMISLAEAIKTLAATLLEEAKGLSVEDLYQKVPGPLKGYVELAYDLNNFPVIRFIEGLLYKSKYWDTSLHALNLEILRTDERPFMLSTPRFPNGNNLMVDIAFESEGIDRLASMRHTPQSISYAVEALGLDSGAAEKFKDYLTTEEPRRRQKYDGDVTRIRYCNHACLLIETKDVSILTDPLLGYEYESPTQRYSFADLPDTIDFALISHGHGDHFIVETLLQIRHKIGAIVVPKTGGGTLDDPSLKLILQALGFKNIIELDEMEVLPIKGGFIAGLPFLGEHADLSVRAKTAYLIQLGGKSVLCAADSRNVSPELYRHIHDWIGDIDVLYLGMECDGAPLSWLYGNLRTRQFDRQLEKAMDQTRRLSGSDCKLGMEIVQTLGCKQAYVYAMGEEPWLKYITSMELTPASKQIIESDKLVEACRSRGIVSERLFGSKESFL